MSHLYFLILTFSTNFCPIKTALSGNTVWLQVSGFQKLTKMDHYWHFSLTFIHSKFERNFARNFEWDFFLIFSNTMVIQMLVTKKLKITLKWRHRATVFCGWDNFVGCGQRRDNFLGELSYHFHFSLLVSKVHFFALEASSSSSTSSFSAMFAAVQNKRQRHWS